MRNHDTSGTECRDFFPFTPGHSLEELERYCWTGLTMQSKRKPCVDRATEEAHGESYAECIGSDETVCIRGAAGRVDFLMVRPHPWCVAAPCCSPHEHGNRSVTAEAGFGPKVGGRYVARAWAKTTDMATPYCRIYFPPVFSLAPLSHTTSANPVSYFHG